MTAESIRSKAEAIRDNIGKVIVGKKNEIELLLTALISGGHVLIEDNPGMGKTMLANSLARSISAGFSRIQFTPDLLPSDLTGINYFNQKQNEFVFRKGPLFSNIILADEINRATPRTQSALLESMEEKQITIDNTTYKLEPPYMVIATQNPIEITGTFPLPEAQLDRFLIKISIGYPDTEEAYNILERFKSGSPLDTITPAASKDDVLEMQKYYNTIRVHTDIFKYIVSICEATRKHKDILMGASPRGSQALLKTAMARAVIKGRDYVTPDDVKYMSMSVLPHRMIPSGMESVKGGTAEIVKEILSKVEAPTEKDI